MSNAHEGLAELTLLLVKAVYDTIEVSGVCKSCAINSTIASLAATAYSNGLMTDADIKGLLSAVRTATAQRSETMH